MLRRLALLLLALACGAALGAVVTLQPSAAPSEARLGATVSVTGSGFPSGTITAAQVQVTLNPAAAGAGPARTVAASAVTLIVGTTRRVSFQIPADLILPAPTPYRVGAVR